MAFLPAVLIFTATTIYTTRKKIIPPEISAFIFVIIALMFSAYVGFLMGGIDITRGSAAAFSVSGDEALMGGWIFMYFAVPFLAFAMLFGLFADRRTSKSAKSTSQKRLPLESTLGNRSVNIVVAILNIYVFVLFPAIGAAVLRRDEYLFMSAGSIEAIIGTASFPVALVAGTLIASSRRKWVMMNGLAILLLILVFELSKASRAAAGILIFTGIMFLIIARTRPVARLLAFFFFTGIGILTLVAVLQFRGSSIGHGILPYWEILITGQISLSAERWDSAVSNLIATVPITYLSAQVPVPKDLIFVSLSPLPGELAGWYDIAHEQVLFWAVPTNAYGQIASMGPVQGLLSIFLISGLMSVPAVLRSYANSRIRMPLLLFSTALTILTAIMFMQYSIRAGSRWIWLSLGITVIVVAFSYLTRARTSGTNYRRPRISV